ncbi:hypothetical protein ACIOHB_35130 [Streptomyces microflavus]|uniref:hypothetical protein n=1 Tax=Streptomyces microflavus TaxID=1919 RepID=UPI003802F404
MGTDRAVENHFSAGGTSGGRVTWVYRRSATDSNYGYRDFYRITQFTYPGNPTPVTPPAETYVSGCALFNVRCFPGDQ